MRGAAFGFGLLLVLGTTAMFPPTISAQTPPPTAHADLTSTNGSVIGTATFTQASDEVHISIAFRDRTALVGTHGIHIHSVAQCDPPAFMAAGPIFNPANKQHGLLNQDGPMDGDLPNLVIGPAGVAVYNVSAPLVTVGGSAPNSLLGGRGTSLVIFAQPDDDKTQPEGNAGQRVACGAIVAGDASPSRASTTTPGGSQLLPTLVIAVMGGLLIAGGVVLRRRP